MIHITPWGWAVLITLLIFLVLAGFFVLCQCAPYDPEYDWKEPE